MIYNELGIDKEPSEAITCAELAGKTITDVIQAASIAVEELQQSIDNIGEGFTPSPAIILPTFDVAISGFNTIRRRNMTVESYTNNKPYPLIVNLNFYSEITYYSAAETPNIEAFIDVSADGVVLGKALFLKQNSKIDTFDNVTGNGATADFYMLVGAGQTVSFSIDAEIAAIENIPQVDFTFSEMKFVENI